MRRCVVGWIFLYVLKDLSKLKLPNNPEDLRGWQFMLRWQFHRNIPGRVQKFLTWNTKAAPNGKCCEGTYSAIYGEVNVSVSGGYVLQYAGGTRASSCFISVTLKCWSGRKLLGPTTYIFTKPWKTRWIHVTQTFVCIWTTKNNTTRRNICYLEYVIRMLLCNLLNPSISAVYVHNWNVLSHDYSFLY